MSAELDKLTAAVTHSKEAEDAAVASLVDYAEQIVEVKDDPAAVLKLAEASAKTTASFGARKSKLIELTEGLTLMDENLKKDSHAAAHPAKETKHHKK